MQFILKYPGELLNSPSSCFTVDAWVYLGPSYRAMLELESGSLYGLRRLETASMLQKTAKSLKKPFLALIDSIDQKNSDSLAWWASQAASSNPYASLFLSVCHVALAQQIIDDGITGVLLIVVEQQALMLQLEKNLSGRTTNPLETGFLGLCRERLQSVQTQWYAERVKELAAWRNSLRRRLAGNSSKPEVVLVAYADEGNLLPDKGLEDRYYGGLPNWLKDQGYAILWFPIIHKWSLGSAELANRLNNTSDPCYCLQDLLTEEDIRWCCDINAIPGNRLPALDDNQVLHVNDLDVTILVSLFLLQSWVECDGLNELPFWPFMATLSQHRPFIKAFILPFENQPWEKVLCRAIRKFFPDADLVGYQHTTVPDLWFPYFPCATEFSAGVLPKRIITSGKAPCDQLAETGFPVQQLAVGPALRYTWLGDMLTHHRDVTTPNASAPSILVALPIGAPDAGCLLHHCIKAFASQTAWQVAIKPHPTCMRNEDLQMLLPQGYFLPANFTLEVRPLYDSLQDYHLFIYCNSSSAYEALACGMPVISVLPETMIDLEDRLGDKGLPGFRVAESPEQLREMANELIALDTIALHNHARLSQAVVSATFELGLPADFNQFMPLRRSPKISIIIPCYNYAHYLPEAFGSVIKQTFKDFEVIIVDDGSTDHSVEVAQGLIAQHADHKVRLISMPNSGNPAFPRNRGVEESSGEYILFLDADDLIMPTMLEKSCRLLDQYPDVSIASADQLYFTEGRQWVVPLSEYNFSELINNNQMPYCCLFRRKAWEDAGGVPTDTGYEDWDFWIICGIKGHYARRIPEPLTCYRQNEAGRYKNELLVRDTLLRAQIVCKHPELYPQDLVEAARRHLSGYHGKNIWRDSHHAGHGIFVNIAMVTYNRLEYTRQALEVLQLSAGFPHVLTVVDNNSQDGTREYLQGLRDQGSIKNLVLLEENVGLARATNLAWSLEPEAAYLMRVDNDIVMQRDGWLKAMVDTFEQTWQLGVLGYSLEPVSYPLVRLENGLSLRVKNGNVGGGCMMISRRVFDKIGYLCEEYGYYGEDDADYGARVMVTGLLNAYMPDEDAAFHLPEGKAAVIDPLTLISSDGGEEELHAEYRAWKDLLRQKNVLSGHFARNLEKYVANQASCRCKSLFVEDWHAFGGRVPAPIKVAIFSLDVQEQVCFHYRIEAPFRYLAPAIVPVSGIRVENGVAVELNLEAAHEADIILVQRFFPCEVNREIVEHLLSLGKPVVYDTDDLLFAIPPDNPHHEWAAAQAPAIRHFIGRCSAVTVSTEELRRQLLPLQQNVYILPNLLDTNLWRRPVQCQEEPVTIIYAGTNTHAADLALLEEALEAVAQSYGNRVEFRFYGCKTERLTLLPGFSFVPFVQTYSQYAELLQQSGAAIILAPLEETKFNRCKSNVKWLEASACGIAGIYSDLPPYADCIEHGVTGLLVGSDPKQWAAAISLLVERANLRVEIADNARKAVLERYDQFKGARNLLNLYRQLVHEVDPAGSAAHPKVSIIIPVYNQAALTRSCIDRLLSLDEADAEIIVVDNGSMDWTHKYLASLGEPIRLIRHQDNLGFGRGCNSGARVAKGRYLLFLNNDTEPREGWLEPLLKVVDHDNAVGVVGSKLLYPDGTIQHAGVAIVDDPVLPAALSPCHLGYQQPDTPEFNVIRECQAVTAACMLIRRDLFNQVGGFDEGYWNGFEDVDLCFKVHQAGYRIIYQPESVVIHYESRSGSERWASENENLQRLQQRWTGKIHAEFKRVSVDRVERIQ